jgi:predicted nuclease with TOPRIM domain
MCEKLTVFFYPKNQKRRSITMTKPKTLEQLRTEKERAETQLLQEQHKLERLENRKKYLEKGERTKRTHRLCNLGGTIESLAPEVKDLTRTEMTELMEYIFSLAEVQRAVRHMAITHISQANREKELKADGTISSERHAD